MTIIRTNAAMSLDGYISGPDESGFEQLFDFYANGEVEVPTADPQFTFHMTPESAEVWRLGTENLRALVVGRRVFDVTDGWDGHHPVGVPVVVLTHEPPAEWIAAHPDAPFRFVTTGIEDAIAAARALAGDGDIGVGAGIVAQQALDAGLLDEVFVTLVPVLLGGGRPYFETLRTAPVVLDDPEVVVSARATHLRFRVRRDG